MIGTEAETGTGIGTDIVTGTGIVHRERGSLQVQRQKKYQDKDRNRNS